MPNWDGLPPIFMSKARGIDSGFMRRVIAARAPMDAAMSMSRRSSPMDSTLRRWISASREARSSASVLPGPAKLMHEGL